MINFTRRNIWTVTWSNEDGGFYKWFKIFMAILLSHKSNVILKKFLITKVNYSNWPFILFIHYIIIISKNSWLQVIRICAWMNCTNLSRFWSRWTYNVWSNRWAGCVLNTQSENVWREFDAILKRFTFCSEQPRAQRGFQSQQRLHRQQLPSRSSHLVNTIIKNNSNKNNNLQKYTKQNHFIYLIIRVNHPIIP